MINVYSTCARVFGEGQDEPLCQAADTCFWSLCFWSLVLNKPVALQSRCSKHLTVGIDSGERVDRVGTPK